jgi:transcriptional regulator GlxA family with amidase domain
VEIGAVKEQPRMPYPVVSSSISRPLSGCTGLASTAKIFRKVAICHAPWELVSAGLVRGRRLTSYFTLQDDIRNAGGTWVDEPVVEDGNLVTSRQPADIPLYNAAMLELFARAGVAASR